MLLLLLPPLLVLLLLLDCYSMSLFFFWISLGLMSFCTFLFFSSSHTSSRDVFACSRIYVHIIFIACSLEYWYMYFMLFYALFCALLRLLAIFCLSHSHTYTHRQDTLRLSLDISCACVYPQRCHTSSSKKSTAHCMSILIRTHEETRKFAYTLVRCFSSIMN